MTLEKKTKTILFASLIAVMILPFASMDFASADQGRDGKKQKVTDEPTTYDFLKNLMKEGKYVKDKKTKDSKDAKHTNLVTKIDKNKFLVNSEFEYEGKIINQQNVILIKNSDKSITMINEEQGLDVTFYKSDNKITKTLDEIVHLILPVVYAGSGSSDGNGANISLYDSEYGTPGTLNLSDNYSGCVISNQGEFEATVTSSVVDVNWQAHPFYFHWCIIGHEFEDGKVYSEGQSYSFGMNERYGYHSFSHSGGTNWYSVDVDFNYGSW